MAISRAIGRTSTAVDTFSWTPIVAPVNGTQLVLQASPAGGAIKFRTDTGLSSAEFTLKPGIAKNYDLIHDRQHGFAISEAVMWAQAVAGTGPVLADWS